MFVSSHLCAIFRVTSDARTLKCFPLITSQHSDLMASYTAASLVLSQSQILSNASQYLQLIAAQYNRVQLYLFASCVRLRAFVFSAVSGGLQSKQNILDVSPSLTH